jgi:hypothetical protein
MSPALEGQLSFWEAPRQGRTGEDLRRELLASFERGERESTGAELRDAGVARALDTADRLPSAWSAEACYAALLALAEAHAWVDTDMLAEAYPVTCPSPNALGGIWLRAVKAGVLVDKGRSMRTKQPAKHSHRYVRWYSMRFKVGAPTEEQGDAA